MLSSVQPVGPSKRMKTMLQTALGSHQLAGPVQPVLA